MCCFSRPVNHVSKTQIFARPAAGGRQVLIYSIVFKLRKGQARIHPMAFTFPTATPDRLFFPTVHIHDGKVHRDARFDHALFCQVARRGVRSLSEWEESELPASRFVNTKATQKLVESSHHVFRRVVVGTHPNEDVTLRVG